jgi:hypothetical protein
MNHENDDQPMTDHEVSGLLKKWTVSAPASLEARVFGAHRRTNWWQFLLKGYVRVPVPIMCILSLLMFFAVWRSLKPTGACSAENVRPAVTSPVMPVGNTVCPANSKC